MSHDTSKQTDLSYDELLQQNLDLRQEVEALNKQSVYLLGVYAETSRKLQIYSASIKAAVSSLLNHDIFWDGANQYEFLTTINASVSQVSDLTILLTLAFRAEAGSLALNLDPQVLQEMLSVAQATALNKFPGLTLNVTYPADGKMVLVDYEYFTKALLLLFEVAYAGRSSRDVGIIASEDEVVWFLDFSGFNPLLVKIIEQMHNCKTEPVSIDFLSTENILRLHIICAVLHLQGISVEVIDIPDQSPIMRLCVPAMANLSRSV
jgi:hypothetical protein